MKYGLFAAAAMTFLCSDLLAVEINLPMKRQTSRNILTAYSSHGGSATWYDVADGDMQSGNHSDNDNLSGDDALSARTNYTFDYGDPNLRVYGLVNTRLDAEWKFPALGGSSQYPEAEMLTWTGCGINVYPGPTASEGSTMSISMDEEGELQSFLEVEEGSEPTIDDVELDVYLSVMSTHDKDDSHNITSNSHSIYITVKRSSISAAFFGASGWSITAVKSNASRSNPSASSTTTNTTQSETLSYEIDTTDVSYIGGDFKVKITMDESASGSASATTASDYILYSSNSSAKGTVFARDIVE